MSILNKLLSVNSGRCEKHKIDYMNNTTKLTDNDADPKLVCQMADEGLSMQLEYISI